jgi:hypothetical protein
MKMACFTFASLQISENIGISWGSFETRDLVWSESWTTGLVESGGWGFDWGTCDAWRDDQPLSESFV